MCIVTTIARQKEFSHSMHRTMAGKTSSQLSHLISLGAKVPLASQDFH